jgi:carboxynorspermidine decarboxylase
MTSQGAPERLLKALPSISTPAYVVDMPLLKRNMETASLIRRNAGCRVLLATKAFALGAVFPIMREHLDGTTASGLYEARLGRQDFGREVHVFSPAYGEDTFEGLLELSDHVYFNSIRQVERFLPRLRKHGGGIKAGIRINPGYSRVTIGGPLYDPCSPGSRFGVRENQLGLLPWDSMDILHVHALCESLHDGSTGLIEHVASRFPEYVKRVQAVNFGGGHFINKEGYDVDILVSAIRSFRNTFGVDVILEPGGGLVVDAGYLVATVLEVVRNDKPIAVLDTSAACHMPDVLEAPYTPPVMDGAAPGEAPYDFILAGNTCMAGDVIGEYSFERRLEPGDKVIFCDMLQYSFVKNNTFNGIGLPDICLLHEDGRLEVVRRFGYEDFRGRL